jgi:hypothetical protein
MYSEMRMLRLMKDYADSCSDGRTRPVVNKRLHRVLKTYGNVNTPLNVWSEEIKEFGNRYSFTKKITSTPHFVKVNISNTATSNSDVGNQSYNNFRLIDRQYNELCRCDDIRRST